MNQWLVALAGGILIGLAATVLLAANGRIAGISGLLGGLLPPAAGEWLWRAAFLLGLIAAAGVMMTWVPQASSPRSGFSPIGLVVAGLLVGYGTRLGNGCTSGHGVCGLGRRSMRSLAAVLMFMATAMVTTYLTRHVWVLT